ncbi:MAG TPA: RING finger protein [Solirubrobacteraceae bacterium]
MSGPPHAQAAVGRACPYCRFTLKQDIPVTQCPACSSVHHADCWDENGGCAVVACTNGPKAGVAPAAPAPVAPAPPSPPAGEQPPPPPGWHPPPQPPPQPPARRGFDTTKLLIAGLLLLALAVGGAGAAVALSGGGDDAAPAAQRTVVVTEQAEEAAAEATPTPAATAQASADDNDTDTETGDDVDDASPSAAEDLQPVIEAYLAAIQQGDYDTAWDLLSPSYKAWKADNGGRAGWERHESDNEAWLAPDDVAVTLLEYDPGPKIATIRITGPTYDKPGEPACSYEGVTWMRKFGDRWLYDQGYMQRPERRAEWRPQRESTFGYACTNGY